MRFKTLIAIAVVLVITSFTIGYYLSVSSVEYYLSSSEIEGLVKSIAEDVSVIRNLTFKELPKVVVVNKSYVLSTWGSEIPEEVLIFGDILKMTLLVPKDYNISSSYRGLLGIWVAASAGNTVYVVQEYFTRGESPLVQRVLAHELTHVLQYQYFRTPPTHTLDESLAIRSLVEGDADVVADEYVSIKGLGVVSKVSSLTLKDPFIDIQLTPYIFGSRFVEYLLSVGGWGLVNKAYEDPPKSMKYVMFPQKYLVREGVVDVVVNVSCRVVHEDVLGPSYIYVMISKYFNESYALSMSSEWLGDKVVYCVNNTYKVLNWVIKWSSSKSAEDFYRTFNYVLSLNNATSVDGLWFVNDLRLSVYVVGDEVLITSYSIRSPN
jgi:hypothetical protein